jgi:hypothetical protein
MFIIYILGVIATWALGAFMFGVAQADPEFATDADSNSNYIFGVLIISTIWPFALVFLVIVWILGWLTDLGKNWVQK